jgi:uncharacterized protein (DUF927 family)
MSELKTNVRLAREISANAQPAIDTLLKIYLQWRGTVLPDPAPACLRFASKLVHPNGQYFPAMIALLSDPRTGEPLGGIQRTFLAWNGKGKAQVEKGEQKMSLGPCRGGVVRLAEPIDGKPLLLGEGVETVLTVMDATGLPGWATLGTSGLVSFEPPDGITEVILLAENDGGPNEKALNEIVPVLAERGVTVRIARPPAHVKDFNDLVNGKSGHLPEAGRIPVRAAIEAAEIAKAEVEAEPENRPENEDGQFQLTETGLSWRKDERGNWKWIAQPFEVLGWARDLADESGQSGDWGKLIRFENSDGFEIERVVTLASLHSDPGALIGSLGYWGMDIKCTPTARRLFVEYLASVDVNERVTVVRRNGWHDIDGARAFALPGEVINAVGKERVVLAKEAVGPYRQCGTLKDWKATVGSLAADHRLLRFSIATALAGTLLDIGGFESGCFHFFGKSSEGKTTCLRVAASVWGSGADGGYVRTWRATANGLEAAFAGASDTCLPLDELGQVEGRELGQALYMATGGVGKQRMRRDATLKPSHSWRVMVLSSGEFPIETKLNEDPKHGVRAHAGQLVRAVDIPVCGVHGVFDAFEPDDVDPSAFAEKCKNATSTFYGMAGPEFVRQLIAQNISAKHVREHVDAFVQSALRDVKDRHGQAARVAQRFGLVCAAGELGAQFGILPWEQSDPLNDATELLKVWLDERGGGSTPYETRLAVAQVRHFIEAHGDSRFDDITTPDPDRKPVANRAGFRRDHGEARRWLIPPEVWRNEVCTSLNAREVAKTLAGLHMLEPDGEGKFSRSETVGGRKQRFYVLKPAIFEGWDEVAETPPEHLEHQAHTEMRVSQNRGSQE